MLFDASRPFPPSTRHWVTALPLRITVAGKLASSQTAVLIFAGVHAHFASALPPADGVFAALVSLVFIGSPVTVLLNIIPATAN
jgi:hypothetical protein